MKGGGRVDKFFLPPPKLGNLFTGDLFLQSVLRRLQLLPRHPGLEPQLAALGARVASDGDLTALGDEAEACPPRLVAFGPWGQRVDKIEVSRAWRELEREAARLGLVATGYDRAQYGELARLAQFSKMCLFYAATAVFSCPLAMADGAARVLEVHGGDDAAAKERLRRLTSTDPNVFITSGQHMTERTGGSDVGNSETVAVRQPDGSYALTGYKFFTSATTSAMAIVLARIVGEDGRGAVQGSRGLSCFILPMERDAEGMLPGITVHQLKEKLGTKAVPTAELEYRGARALLLGQPERGIPTIASQFNITRWQNAVHCVSSMQRIMAMCRAHAQVRSVFGGLLSENRLHLATLAEMELETRAATLLVAHTSVLLGKEEFRSATKEEGNVLRLLTPICKLYTAKQGMFVASEGIEALGGVGYCEPSGMPRLFRDMQVAPVWEGTTNVLALDIWRALVKENSLGDFLADVRARAAGSQQQALIETACKSVAALAQKCSKDAQVLEASARQFAFALSRLYIAGLFAEHAAFTKDPVDEECSSRWAHNQLNKPVDTYDAHHRAMSKKMCRL